MLKIYTDGAATMKKIDNNYEKGPGGWAYCILDEKDNCLYKESDGKNPTTNNEMELTGILRGLEQSLNLPSEEIEVYSDSAYCINTFTGWVFVWVNNDWTRGKKKEEIKNVDLIKKIYNIITESNKKIKFIKVKGHSDDYYNEVVDHMAVVAKEKYK